MIVSFLKPSVGPLLPQDVPEAAELLVRAYSTNPINVAVVGDRTRNARELYRFVLTELPGITVCIRESGRVIGVMRFVESKKCQPPKSLKSMFQIWKIAGSRTPRLLKWVSSWGKLDPKERHFHLGPIAVDPEYQGKGYGSCMLEYFRTYVDKLGEAAYLETDKPENVKLYQRFGFSIIHEESILGVPNWFMWRPPVKQVVQSVTPAAT